MIPRCAVCGFDHSSAEPHIGLYVEFGGMTADQWRDHGYGALADQMDEFSAEANQNAEKPAHPEG